MIRRLIFASQGCSVRHYVLVLAILCALPLGTGAQEDDAGPHSDGLSRRAEANLVAFARLYGIVRFFHPTEAVRTADWGALAIAGVASVEACRSPDCLANALARVFGGVAPTLRVDSRRTRSAWSPMDTALDAGNALSAIPSVESPVRYWDHDGVSTGDLPGLGGNYASWLRAGSGGVARARHRAPSGAVRLSLPGGVNAFVPVVLPITPGADTAARPYDPPRRAAQPPTGTVARETAVAAVIAAWATLRHFYPYAVEAEINWDLELRRALRRAAVARTDAEVLAVLKRLTAALRDGHAFAARLDIAPTDRPLAPAVLLDWVEGAAVVTHAGPAAAAAGLRTGDVVRAVGGVPIQQALREALETESGATRAYARLRALRFLLLGPAGTSIRLRVTGETSAAPREVELRRDSPPPRTTDRPPRSVAAVRQVAPGVTYVDADHLTESSAVAVRRTGAMIVDLRGYPPFDVNPMLSRLVNGIGPRRRIALLIGTATISAVETALLAVERIDGVVLVGERTAGTTGAINYVGLPGGMIIQFTGVHVRRPDGGRFHGVGIVPDIRVMRTIRGVARGEDEVLSRAIVALTERGSPTPASARVGNWDAGASVRTPTQRGGPPRMMR